MKNIVMLSIAALALTAYPQSVDDTCISFFTQGPDRYSDGTTVLDGECYALVHSSDGVFDGFTANGECVDSDDTVVMVAPVAKDGRCPLVLFQIPSSKVDTMPKSRYSVCLLDTREIEGGVVKPRGAKDGKPDLVNGYGEVTASLKLEKQAVGNRVKESVRDGLGQKAGNVAVSAPDTRQPKIKSVQIDGDEVSIIVENLEGYMRVQSGSCVKEFKATGPATKTSGETGEVILKAPKSGSSGFYKIIRSR